jgi:hypothetical protein
MPKIPDLTKIPSSSPRFDTAPPKPHGIAGDRLRCITSAASCVLEKSPSGWFVNPRVVEVPAAADRMAISAVTLPREKSDPLILADCV